MEKNPDTINLEWYHHIEKIHRQQRKEEKVEGTSSKTITSTEESHVEVEPLETRRKITRQSVAEAINIRPRLKETRMYSQRYVLFVEETPRGSH
jgi:hypothetical protein